MSAPVVLVAGTWGEHPGHGAWWRPDSPFAQELFSQGVTLLSPEDPFRWSTDLDGVRGDHTEWNRAADALRWFIQAKQPPRGLTGISVVAHSHGGNVALLAAAAGQEIDRLITVATPVRLDLRATYNAARARIAFWIHLYSDASDFWQWAGSWFDGPIWKPSSWILRRRMRWADLNFKTPAVGHTGLLDPALWRTRRYGYWLTASASAIQARIEVIKRGRA